MNQEKKYTALSETNIMFIEEGLNKYIDAVALKKPITLATGGKEQQRLDAVFHYVLKLEGLALIEGLNLLKDFIFKHKDGIFSPNYAYRFINNLPGGAKVQKTHVNLIELLSLKGKKRKAELRQMDINSMLSYVPEGKRQQLVEYFTRVV